MSTSFYRLRVGKAGTPYDSTLRPSPDNNLAGVYEYPPKEGVPLAVSTFLSLVPLTIVAGNIATAQTLAGAGNLTLTAGTGVTTAIVQGQSVLKLDCARCVALTGVGGTVAVLFTVRGFDDYYQPLTATFTGPAGATTVVSLKAFRYIASITGAGATTSTVAAQISDTIGLPYRVDAFENVMMAYNGAAVAANTGLVVADATSPATALTGDVRGTYALQTASNGTRRLGVEFQILNPDTVTAVWGVPQF